ncbi:unnamed protein product, partial [Discosporangium mesarthrocarpum]
MPIEDGLTPLLGGDQNTRGISNTIPGSRKLAVLAVALGISCTIDVLATAAFSTGVFGKNWKQYLGIGDGAYPYGSAGLDLLILAILRSLYAVTTCVAYYVTLRHHGQRQPSSSSLSLQDPGMFEGHIDRQEEGGKGADGGNGQSIDPNPPPQAARLLCTVCPLFSPVTLLLLVSKCVGRLVAGPESHKLGLQTGYFWAAVGWSALAAGGAFWLITALTSSIGRHSRLLRARERGDLNHFLAAEVQAESERKLKGSKLSFMDLFKLAAEDWKLILLAFIALVLAAVAQVMMPHFTGNMIDNVVETGDQDDFRRSTLYLVLAAVACAAFSGIRGGIFTIVGAKVGVRIRLRLFRALVRQEIGFFDTTKTGDLSSRLSNDCTKIADQITLNINVLLRNIVQVITTLLFMFYLSWRLSLVAFISVPVIIVISNYYGAFIRRLSRLSQDKLAEAGTVVEESLSSMTTVRSFAAEENEIENYAKVLASPLCITMPIYVYISDRLMFYDLNLKGGIAYGFYAASSVLLPQLVTAVVIFYGGTLVMQGQLSGGKKVVTFMLYLDTLSSGFDQIGAIYSSVTQAVGAAEKVFELIRREPVGEVGNPPVIKAKRDCPGEIELRGVRFWYPSRPEKMVLDRLSFKVAPGEVLALVGPSGGGKSSCIALLENFYQPSEGEVLLDGVPVHRYEHAWLHRNVSIVGQEPTLYARSIKENIVFGLDGDDEPSHKEVEEAAQLANAHAFISALPEGYNTQAGERGVQMSGGQKQRIAIARALVRRPRVLLLDEATSALDAESEHSVQQAIDHMIAQGGMTVILIAHRLSTVKRADKIAVIQAGRVVEEGTHEELLEREGVYSGLVKRQLDLGNA